MKKLITLLSLVTISMTAAASITGNVSGEFDRRAKAAPVEIKTALYNRTEGMMMRNLITRIASNSGITSENSENTSQSIKAPVIISYDSNSFEKGTRITIATEATRDIQLKNNVICRISVTAQNQALVKDVFDFFLKQNMAPNKDKQFFGNLSEASFHDKVVLDNNSKVSAASIKCIDSNNTVVRSREYPNKMEHGSQIGLAAISADGSSVAVIIYDISSDFVKELVFSYDDVFQMTDKDFDGFVKRTGITF